VKRSASVLILNGQNKLLLLQRSSESKNFQDYWEFPGGKIDTSESRYQAVLRETQEETGLSPDFPACEPLWQIATAQGEVEYSFFVWKPASADLNVCLSDEHEAFEWVSFTEARKKRMMPPHREFMDRYWHQEQIGIYEQELPHYVAYRRFLELILSRLKARWSHLAIVQAREKSISSFAEKCVRKADRYNDPARQLTDLCGARIIAPTTHEVATFVRQIQNLFVVDELDDTSQRHDIAEFGYLSMHLIVHVRAGVKTVLGVPVPQEIGSRKAEIQVRTMLQHAHSEVTHDRLYKSGFNVPKQHRREAARVAAVLESTDNQFAAFVSRLDAYVGHYASHLPPEERRREIEDLKLVLGHEREEAKKPPLALRLARQARAAWDWEIIVEIVEPYITLASTASDDLNLELGHALCRLHPHSTAQFHRGMDLLESVARSGEASEASIEADERDRRATALAWLGWAYARIPGNRAQARVCLEKTFELAPENPYNLLALVELDVTASGTDNHLSLLAPTLRQAAGRCEEHLRAGIEVTRAWLALATLRFLLNDACSAFESMCVGARAAETYHPLEELAHSFEQLKDAIGGRRPEIDWLCAAAQLLSRSKRANGGTGGAASNWHPLIQRFQHDPASQVTIFAGATAAAETERLAAFEPFLEQGLKDHAGTFISGGTTAGVCGLAERLATRLNANGARIQLVGYTPENFPIYATAAPGYRSRVITIGRHEFSPMEPIQMWTDLLMSGVPPRMVRTFCIGGGNLSAMELALAWALGAQAAVVSDSSDAARRFGALLDWSELRSGILLPNDPATITGYFAFDASIDAKNWERSGEAVHESYVRSQQKGAKDPNLLPWRFLCEDFKHSNRHQAACSVEILRRRGFLVEQTSLPLDQISLVRFTDEQVEQLAELEHGRWNIERLKAGWRYGEKKDAAQKISPYLVPWNALSEAIKAYDRAAVRDWPAVLARAGWRVTAE
jgi:mutator protein MutT